MDFWLCEPWSQYSAQHAIVFTRLSLSFYLNLCHFFCFSLRNRAKNGSFNLSNAIFASLTRVVILILSFVLISVTVSISVGVSVNVNANVNASSLNRSLYNICTNGSVNVLSLYLILN